MYTAVILRPTKALKKYVHDSLPEFEMVFLDDQRKIATFFDQLDSRSDSVDLIIIGSAVSEPVRTAQKVHFIDKNISVMMLSTSDDISSLSQALQTSPLLGDEVSAQVEVCRKVLIRRIKEAANNTKNRRRYSQTITQLNQDIDTGDRYLSEANRYLNRLLEEAPIGICMTDTNYTMLAMNSYASSLLRVDERSALGKPLPALLESEHMGQLEQYFRTAAAGMASGPQTFLQKGKPGRYLQITVSGSRPNMDHAGILVLIQDVTDREMAAEKEKERIRLVALNESKDEFISLASHQLRTPATTVKQYVGMVLEGYFGEMNDIQREMLQAAYVSNERQIQIVNDLLKVARIDAGKLVLSKMPVNFSDMVQDIVRDALPKFQKINQKLSYSSDSEHIEAWLDPIYIRMAIENLVDNAHKYTPGDKQISIELKQHSDKAILTVEDEGVGIKPEDHKKLFRKFSRIDNPLSVEVGGTGLGLYWSKKVIEHHGGDVSVRSRPNVGTVFTVTLPLKTA